METSFSELKQKEVVNVVDGRRLGRTCDIVFTYPEGRVCGITKIGEDVVLVNLRPVVKSDCKPDKKRRCGYGEAEYECPPPPPPPKPDRRSYDEYE